MFDAIVRRAALGAACAVLVWPWAHPFALWVLAVGALVGVAYGGVARASSGSIDAALTAAAVALPLWLVIEVLALPLAHGATPAWTASGLRAAFAALPGWFAFGCALGVGVERLARRASGESDARPTASGAPVATRVVILGGGFAGMTTALELERALGADPSVAITLVSRANALLFTPMLAEVAGGSLEPTHVNSPLRMNLRRTDVVRARVRAIDLEARRVDLESDAESEPPAPIDYDHLILALGSVSNFFGSENIARVALDFKSLGDAIAIRSRAIARLERADREPDARARRRLLTFVVAGGGFAGIELAGALNDFVRGAVADYANLHSQDVRVVVVHARERILPELGATLAAYALARMSERGVEFRLGTRVADAEADAVHLEPPETIEASTLIWTAGTRPHPLLATLDIERDRRGAAVVDAALAVPGRPNLWALGDCAAIPDGEGGTFPPTAQHAIREAKVLARNVVGTTRGQAPVAFAFRSLGSLCVIGHQLACAELRVPLGGGTLYFSGAFAWLLWRAIYLAKLPGFERKVRVLVDWVAELFFPRDTVDAVEIA